MKGSGECRQTRGLGLSEKVINDRAVERLIMLTSKSRKRKMEFAEPMQLKFVGHCESDELDVKVSCVQTCH